MDYWANFARTGNPNGPHLIEWLEYDEDTKTRMFFDEPMRTAPAANEEKCEFWREQHLWP